LLSLSGGEVGPIFGTFRAQQQGVEQFLILAANMTSFHVAPLNAGGRCCNEDDDWYRLQLRVDLTANNGAGAGAFTI
jgi:hypothetical protein